MKLTGGEPTVRRDLPEIVARLRAIDPGLDLSMTTNGLLLDRLAGPLRAAGLDRLTVSLDSLLRHRYAEMTRRDALARVHAGLEAARAAGFERDQGQLRRDRGRPTTRRPWPSPTSPGSTGSEVRFIEYMPLDADHAWERVQGGAVLGPARPDRVGLSAHARSTRDLTRRRLIGSRTARPASVGFISTVTEPFCDTCNRVRLTADGQLRACLFALEETDLRAPAAAGRRATTSSRA